MKGTNKSRYIIQLDKEEAKDILHDLEDLVQYVGVLRLIRKSTTQLRLLLYNFVEGTRE